MKIEKIAPDRIAWNPVADVVKFDTEFGTTSIPGTMFIFELSGSPRFVLAIKDVDWIIRDFNGWTYNLEDVSIDGRLVITKIGSHDEFVTILRAAIIRDPGIALRD